MQANNLFEYRDKIFDAFKDGTFLSEHLKKLDDAAYDYVLKHVNDFIQEIKLMEEKINLGLLDNFFGFSSSADYANILINIENPDENKGVVAEAKDTISDLKDRIKEMSETEKNYKNGNEALEIIEKILEYNKDAQKNFVSKVDKGKSKPEGSIAERKILRKEMVAEIDDQVYTIKKMLSNIKKLIKKVPENKKCKIEENQKIINIVDNILYFNQSEQGLKIFTLNQMLSRLPIS